MTNIIHESQCLLHSNIQYVQDTQTVQDTQLHDKKEYELVPRSSYWVTEQNVQSPTNCCPVPKPGKYNESTTPTGSEQPSEPIRKPIRYLYFKTNFYYWLRLLTCQLFSVTGLATRDTRTRFALEERKNTMYVPYTAIVITIS